MKFVIKAMIVSLVFVCTLSLNIGFSDNVDGQNYGYILKDIGIISGDGTSLLEQKNLTREEMITILARFFPSELNAFVPPKTPTFIDVPSTHWAYKFIEFAYSKGIASGVGNNRFGRGLDVNYNQASLLIIRTLGYDTTDIDYKTAATTIARLTSINLTANIEPMESLKRIHVFELIAKMLVTSDPNDDYMISKLGLSQEQTDNYIDRFNQLYSTPLVIELDSNRKEIRFSNGDVYVGELSNGLINGIGSYYFKNGDSYTGGFLNNYFHGMGIIIYADGSFKYGEWSNGDLVVESQNEISSNYKLKFVDEFESPIQNLMVSFYNVTTAKTTFLLTDVNGCIYFPIESNNTIYNLKINLESGYYFRDSTSEFQISSITSDKTYYLKKR